MNAEKLMTLIAIPAYDPINIVKIILIISCTMDVWVIKACFCHWRFLLSELCQKIPFDSRMTLMSFTPVRV